MKIHLPVALSCLLFLFPAVSFSQSPVLGAATDFVLFTTTGAVGNTGVSIINGKIGTNNGAITGFTPVPGQEENANILTAQAGSDLQDAYDSMYLITHTALHAPVLGGGETLFSGVYLIAGAGSIDGNLILDAQGIANAIFIFKIGGAFSPGPSSMVTLIGGAQACNIYWLAEGGAIAIATLATMKGNFIANPGAVSMAATGSLEGRLLSTTGAIAVDGLVASLPICFALPVTLTSFTARKNNTVVNLLWTVEDEFLFSGYEVQRSSEGQMFSRLATVPRSATPSPKTYSWNDNSPLQGINFYRLKMIDLDGRFSYSPVATVDMNRNSGISIYPNPVTDRTIILDMKGQPKGVYNISVYTTSGQKMMTGELMQNDNSTFQSIALEKKLPGGFYFLRLVGPGNINETIKFFIQ